MGHIENIVDSLEHKISSVLQKLEDLQQTNLQLNNELDILKKEILEQKLHIAGWEERYNALKMVNSMLGSNENKRETKLKINALIKDIDHCIGQLSD